MVTVVLSLDTELAWGRLSDDKQSPLLEDPSAGRDAVSYTLETLDRYDVPATWGIVGHLLLEECTPSSHYSAPHVKVIDPYSNRMEAPLYYAPEILASIRDSDVDHEIAGHSFSHPHLAELPRETARAELDAMVGAFAGHGVKIESMIHPFIDLAHLDMLPDYGITTYSGSSLTRNYTLRGGLPRLLRRDPALLSAPPVRPTLDEHGLIAIPRSRSLRDERWGWLNPRRLRNGIQSAAKDEFLHLSFHPHNVIYDAHLRRTLPTVVEIIDRERDRGNVRVATFSDVSLPGD